MLGIGIVGLPNVGKSTLFNTLTRARVEAANYPFATIEKNIGVVPVPDPRLAALRPLFGKGDRLPALVPTTVELVDIAGLVRGASKGEGLGNQFLAHIREAAAVAHVVRCFEDPNVVHVDGRIDPAGDIEIVGSELALADIANLERRLEKLQRSAKGSKGDAALVEAVAAMIDSLSAGVPARASDIGLPADFDLLTAKPVIYVCNVAEDGISGSNPHVRAVQEIAAEEGGEVVIVSARVEQELSDLAPEEAAEFLVDLGLEEPGLNRLIRIGHQTLGLITFFTGNAKEVHAWTTRQGNRAPQAAAEVHTDFERGFIRAEVIAWDRLVEVGGLAAARARGWLRTEGKEYLVQDGDVLHILFNV